MKKPKTPKPPKEMGERNESKNIDSTLDAIKMKFGEDSIMMLGAKPRVGIDSISTGSIGLDAALGWTPSWTHYRDLRSRIFW